MKGIVIQERFDKFEAIRLKSGSHSSASKGMCAMEAVAWLAGEKFSDRPECVSPVIAEFMRSWNDGMNDADRQILKPYVLKVLDTRSTPEAEQVRGLLVADWTIRVFTPTWLNLANLGKEADALRALPEIKSWDDVVAAQPRLEEARRAGAAARAAAWAAAGDAAGAAARDAAGAAARAAAGAAAWAAAGAAARAAAGAAAWAAAGDAAGDAAWAAAGDAADNALRGTVERLQASALELLDRMIAVK